jgi:uracil-DNA glycosylase
MIFFEGNTGEENLNEKYSPQPDSWPALNDEIVACRACPRLVAWREQVAREKRRA